LIYNIGAAAAAAAASIAAASGVGGIGGAAATPTPDTRLYIGSLHYDLKAHDLRAIFEVLSILFIFF
jgi:hypothetical protein